MLPGLQSLRLNGQNALTGLLPATWANTLPRLQQLSLEGGNQLTGTVRTLPMLPCTVLRSIHCRWHQQVQRAALPLRLPSTRRPTPPGTGGTQVPTAFYTGGRFGRPFTATLRPGNPQLCGPIYPAPNYTLLYDSSFDPGASGGSAVGG